MKREAAGSFEVVFFCWSTWLHVSEDHDH